MIYTELTKRAINLCYNAHKGQVDKSGLPYVFHPYHLAEQMTTEYTVVVALLHDIVEDTEYTFDDLYKMDFPNEVINALKLLTHDKDVPYMDYVRAIKSNPIARSVKMADLIHNSDISRLPGTSDKDIERLKKYAEAYRYLSEDSCPE